jgi:hypothetical protein
MSAAPQLCRQVLSCLTRQPQLLALQQLPLLQQLALGHLNGFSNSPADCGTIRSYARLPGATTAKAADMACPALLSPAFTAPSRSTIGFVYQLYT